MNRMVAIVGPTASGKSELAMRVARDFRGEIICADSRTIYKGMDIGTAKPTSEERSEISHHLLDILEPNQSYSAAEFKAEANLIIEDINSRGRLPILTGGTGLYIYAVIYNYLFPAGARDKQREELERMPLVNLVEKLRALDPEMAELIDLKNPRRVIRAIETVGQPRSKSRLMPGTLLVGLKPTNEELSQRIKQRTDRMIAEGLVREVVGLVKSYGSDTEAFRSPGYSEVIQVLNSVATDTELVDLINLHTHQLAKRQLTWFKRNRDIIWFHSIDASYKFISEKLSES